MRYDDVLMVLPTLNKKQLAALRATIDNLIGGQADPNDHSIELFQAVTTVIGMKGLTFENFHKTTTYKTWVKHAGSCIEFVDTTWPEAVKSKVTKQALMCFLMCIMRDSIKAWGVPVTLNSMVNSLGQLESLFDHAFPGYRESGMADLILLSMQRKGPVNDRKAKPKG